MTPHISITLLRTQSDDRLVALTAAGHDRAFEAIVDRYRRPLLRYARRMLHEEARAEDVVQAGLVSAWAALREGVEVRDLRPWLYRIVHNGALNAMQRPSAEPLIEASDLRAGPDAVIERREEVRRAFDGIASLPERQRAALLAVAFEGRSHAEVGEELGLKDGAVRQLVSRARASLRTAATALTPYPVVLWAAQAGGPPSDEMGARIGELIAGAGVAAGAGAGAGTVLGGGAAVKAGAVLATAGVLAVGAPKVAHVIREDSTPAPAVAKSATAREAARAVTTGSGRAGLAPATGDDAPGPSADQGTHRDRSSGPDASGREGSRSGSSTPSGDDGRRGASSPSATEDVHSGSGDERSGSSHGGSGERFGRHRRDEDGSSGDEGSGHSGSGEVPSGGEDHGASETADEGSGSSGGAGSSDGGSSGSSGSSVASGTPGTSGSGSSGSGSSEPASRERETEAETETETP